MGNKLNSEFYLVNPNIEISIRNLFCIYSFDREFNHANEFDYGFSSFHYTDHVLDQYNKFVIEQEISFPNDRFVEMETNMMMSYPLVYMERAMIVHRIMREQNVTLSQVTKDMYQKGVERYQRDYIRLQYMQEINPSFTNKVYIEKDKKNYPDGKCTDLELGAEFEEFLRTEFRRAGHPLNWYASVNDQQHGENEDGIEIKHDMVSMQTGNFYLEVCEYTDKNKDKTYIPADDEFTFSGILKNDNTKFFIIGTQQEYYFVRKEDLIELLSQTDLHFPTAGEQVPWQQADNRMKLAIAHKEASHSKGLLLKRSKIREIAVASSVSEFVDKFYVDKTIPEHKADLSINVQQVLSQIKQKMQAKDIEFTR